MCARSIRQLIHIALTATLACPATAVPFAWQAAGSENDPLLGRWTLVTSKSRYTPGPPPQSQTRVYEAQQKGIRTTITTVSADGETTTVEYAANYDSVEYHVTGSAATDGIALKRVDPYTAEASLTHAGRITGTARRVIAADGQTMTITFRDVRGVVHNVAFYEKAR